MDGTLHMVDGRPTLRFERKLAHPIEKVWRALTEPAELSGWFPWRIELDARVDGRMSFTHPQGAATAPDAVITEWDPPHAFAYFWNDGELRWALTEDGDGCVLVFTHGFAERPPAAKFAAGWHVSLDALESVLDGQPVRPGPWAELNRHYVHAFGLLDGDIVGDQLRFEQELVQPAAVVWATLMGEVSVGEIPPASCSVGDAGPVTQSRPGELIAYPVVGGEVRISVVPQDFGVRVVLTQTGPADSLRAARTAWHEKLVTFADELDGRPGNG